MRDNYVKKKQGNKHNKKASHHWKALYFLKNNLEFIC